MPGTSIADKRLQNAVEGAGAERRSDSSYGPPCLGCPVHCRGFCGRLGDAELHDLSARASTRTMPAGRSLDIKYDGAQFAIMAAGFLRICRHRADGHRQIIDLVGPGELIEFSQMSDFVEIQTVTESRICRIHSNSAADLLSTSCVFRSAVIVARQQMADRWREHAWALGALRPAERIALFLLNSCAHMPWQRLRSGGGILTMQLPRTDIADYLGTTVETFCRVLGKLDEAGLIRAHDAWHFEIPDLSRLGRFARIGKPLEKAPMTVSVVPFGDDVRQCVSAGTGYM